MLYFVVVQLPLIRAFKRLQVTVFLLNRADIDSDLGNEKSAVAMNSKNGRLAFSGAHDANIQRFETYKIEQIVTAAPWF